MQWHSSFHYIIGLFIPLFFMPKSGVSCLFEYILTVKGHSDVIFISLLFQHELFICKIRRLTDMLIPGRFVNFQRHAILKYVCFMPLVGKWHGLRTHKSRVYEQLDERTSKYLMNKVLTPSVRWGWVYMRVPAVRQGWCTTRTYTVIYHLRSVSSPSRCFFLILCLW